MTELGLFLNPGLLKAYKYATIEKYGKKVTKG